jgi:hypothetical protein
MAMRAPCRNCHKSAGSTGRVESLDLHQEQLWMESRAWEAFPTFAPYAYEASMWDDGADELVALNSCAEAIVASLTADQAEAVGRVIGPGRVVPVNDWRKRRRAQRHRRSAR